MDDAFTEDLLLFKVFKLEFSFKTHFQKRRLNAVMDASILPGYLFVGQQSISVAQSVYGQNGNDGNDHNDMGNNNNNINGNNNNNKNKNNNAV